MSIKSTTLLVLVLAASALSVGAFSGADNSLLAPGDGVVYGPVKSDGSRVQANTPGAEVVHFEARGPELMMQVTGDPGQLYFVMISPDMQAWQFHDLAFEVSPGQFMMFSEGAGPACARRVFLKVKRPRGPKPCNPHAHAQSLYQSVPNLEFLTGAQLTAAWAAATAVADAYVAYNAKQNEIILCTRMLRDCLDRVAELRAEAEAAEQRAKDAEAEAKRIEDEIHDLDAELFDIIEQRKEAEKEVQKWEDLWNDGSALIDAREAELAYTTDPDRRATLQAEIDTLRSNMDDWIEKRNEAQDRVDALEQQEANKRAEGEARLPDLEAARAAAEAARTEADEAWRKLREEMDKCDQIRDDIRRKQAEAEDARKKLQEEADKFAAERARLAAEGEAEKARQEAAAAAAEETEQQRIEEAARRERERAERNMRAWQQWLQDIENMHGEDGMKKIVAAFILSGGAELVGTTTEGVIDFLGGAGAANTIAGATSGLLQGGWSFLVAAAQAAAEKGVTGILQNRVVQIAVQEFVEKGNPAPGTIKHYRVENQNPDGTRNVEHSMIMVANADGSITVFASSKRTGGAVETYVVKP